MQIEEANPYGATSPEAIAQFEARRGVLLPPDDKQFLPNSNGGYSTPNVFEVPGWHGQGSSLLMFYGIRLVIPARSIAYPVHCPGKGTPC